MKNKFYIVTFHRYFNSPVPHESSHVIEATSFGEARKVAFEFAKKTWRGPAYLMSIKKL